MSIKLMTKVWEDGPEDRTETLVLLALADRANDDGGSCFPSIADVAQRSRLTRRGTQKVIRRLEDKGFLTVDENSGPGGTNNYQLHPAQLEGRTECTGGERDSPGGEPDDEKGRTRFARNHQEPSDNREGAPARGKEVCNEVEQGMQRGRTEVCNEVDTQKKEKETEGKKAPAREEETSGFDPIEVLIDLWDVSPSIYQKERIRAHVTDEALWRRVLHDLKMQNKDSKKAIGWAFSNYQQQDTSSTAREVDESAKAAGGHHWDEDGFLRTETGAKVYNPRGYPKRR